MKSDIVTVTAVPTARLRCPLFGGDPDAQRFWNALWDARLRILARLFPFVSESIRALAELPREAAIGGSGDHATNAAYLAAHDEYAKGYRSERPEVRAIHDRQNAEWEALTGLPALGSLNDWRAAAAAAGIPAADFEQHDFKRIADCVLAWALAKVANRSTAGGAVDARQPPSPKPSAPAGGDGERAASATAETGEHYTVKLMQAAALISRSKRTMERWVKDDPGFPLPDVDGGGGKPNEWKWSRLRSYLETKIRRKLPERFPADPMRPDYGALED